MSLNVTKRINWGLWFTMIDNKKCCHNPSHLWQIFFLKNHKKEQVIRRDIYDDIKKNSYNNQVRVNRERKMKNI